MELAILNLSGDLAHPNLIGLLHAYDPELEVELELVDEIDDAWFVEPDTVLDDDAPADAERGWFARLLSA